MQTLNTAHVMQPHYGLGRVMGQRITYDLFGLIVEMMIIRRLINCDY